MANISSLQVPAVMGASTSTCPTTKAWRLWSRTWTRSIKRRTLKTSFQGVGKQPQMHFFLYYTVSIFIELTCGHLWASGPFRRVFTETMRTATGKIVNLHFEISRHETHDCRYGPQGTEPAPNDHEFYTHCKIVPDLQLSFKWGRKVCTLHSHRYKPTYVTPGLCQCSLHR